MGWLQGRPARVNMMHECIVIKIGGAKKRKLSKKVN